jgi:seryl-tRNA(Sec) selenium transferase
MKKPIALISTEGKSKEEIMAAAQAAMEKYQQAADQPETRFLNYKDQIVKMIDEEDKGELYTRVYTKDGQKLPVLKVLENSSPATEEEFNTQ